MSDHIALAQVSYDLNGAARATGLSVTTIKNAVRDGDLVPNYSGTKPVFRAVELDAWIAAMPTERRAAS